ncbi:MAG: glutamate--tRNA ligase [Holosporales bacterium]|jgi:glutamyl-tRNA synthetase|nr:glutamate--tRNA ligase [Holosporales bacterium]
MNCKVRFAPSPTGFLHIGNARIAVVNYLFAKKNNGRFLLRIDDTDAIRSKKEYEDSIIEDLAWLGIEYDETFRQSERKERYDEIKNNLVADGVLYKCYESQEELEYKRKVSLSKGIPPVYDRHSLTLTDEQKQKFESDGVPSYWRFKLPNKIVSWDDIILGEISYDLNNVSDPVVIKADGTYLYSFSSVVDDSDSGVTHIIRGQDHVTNTAVQIAMFDKISKNKFNAKFAHLSLFVNKDGSQFSKRLGSMNLGDLRKRGIDPMAISNLLATLGSSLDVSSFQNMDDLIEYFDIRKFSANSPKFDIDDVLKLNGKIIRSKPYKDIKKFGLSEDAFEVIKDNIENYNDFKTWKDILKPGYISNYVPNAQGKKLLETAISELENVVELDNESSVKFLERLKSAAGVSGKELYIPLRESLTNMEHGPNITQLFTLFGKKETQRRFASTVLKSKEICR